MAKTNATKTNAAKTKGVDKTAAKSAQTPAKVGKLDKAAGKSAQAPAPAKAGKAAKAPGAGQAAARARYAGRKIRILPAAKDATFRGGRAVRWEMVRNAKTTDDVLGVAYRLDGEAEDRTFNASNLAPFVDKGLIEIA